MIAIERKHLADFLTLTVMFVALTNLASSSQVIPRSVFQRRQRGTQLTAQEIADRYMAGVVLIVCDDITGTRVQGSGFFLTKDIIVTNYHIVKGMIRGYIKLRPVGSKTQSIIKIDSIVAYEEQEDLALVAISEFGRGTLAGIDEIRNTSKAARESTSTIQRRDPLGIDEFLENRRIPPLAAVNTSITVGETVFVLSNPEGLEGTISSGLISSIRPHGSSRWLQTTAPISPGSSGGPLLNTRGQVIGVVVASVTEGQNLNFAIPFESVRKLHSRIKN